MDIPVRITDGLHCASCVRRLKDAFTDVPGVSDVRVELTTRRAVFAVDQGGPDLAGLLTRLQANGFTAQADGAPVVRAPWWPAALAVVLAVATFGVPQVFTHELGHGLATACAAIAVLVPGWVLVRAAASAARQGRASMDTLIVLGSLAALLAGEAHAAAVTVALTLIGRLIEARARRATAAAVEQLAHRAPDSAALVSATGEERAVPLASVMVGDRVRVRVGSVVPVDGTVSEGTVSLDEAMLTGEALPVAKAIGDAVASGTIVVDGTAVITATRIGAETTLARLAALVQAAAAGKPTVQRLVDGIASVFVPVVLLLALVTWTAWWWQTGQPGAGVLAAAAVLVIACPCALGLATPTALVAASGAAARSGIFVLTPRAFEAAARITAVAFDKTGTLTTGAFIVERVLCAPDLKDDAARVLAVAAAVEQGSDHPLALAIRCAHLERAIAPSRGIVQQPQRYTQRAGAGAAADLSDGQALVGTAEWLREHGVEPLAIDALSSGSGSVVHVAHHGVALGAIVLRDADRDEAAAVVAQLSAHYRVLLITGDRAAAASAAGTRLGVDEIVAQCTPAMKLAQITRIQGEHQRVAFVGDGLNDAPVLAAADLGITVGHTSDIAAAAGDVLLPTGDLHGVPRLLNLARRTRRVIVGNLILAAGYNLIALPFAAFGHIDPGFAAGAMVLSSLAVVGNSLRLTRTLT